MTVFEDLIVEFEYDNLLETPVIRTDQPVVAESVNMSEAEELIDVPQIEKPSTEWGSF